MSDKDFTSRTDIDNAAAAAAASPIKIISIGGDENDIPNSGALSPSSTSQPRHQSDSMPTTTNTIRLVPSPEPALPSLSKIAVRIMNITCGLCADPIHYHSFTNASSSRGWFVPTPRDVYIGAFYKCVACRGRLGQKPAFGVIVPTNTSDVEMQPLSSSPLDVSAANKLAPATSNIMMHCIACGVYAHRTCAFARPSSQDNTSLLFSSSIPICKTNLREIQRASYYHRGLLGDDAEIRKEDAIDVAKRKQAINDEETESMVNTSEFHLTNNTIKSKDSNQSSLFSSWYIFRKSASDNDTVDNQFGEKILEQKADHPLITPMQEKDPIVQHQQQPGVIESSLQLIKKTTEATIHIPTASAIGMVAGGAAGWALAGPAGVIVGSQIGRTVLTVGAVVEGGVGIAMLAMNLAKAANYSMTRSSASSDKKERELTLKNGVLVLVRPDIEVDPIWGVYANEARNAWQRERNEHSVASSSSSSTRTTKSSGYALGKLLFTSTTTSSNEEPNKNMRYHKDSDIVKADANELPTRDKVFLLVNRILNDKTSLPGYQYRSLIMKHKRRTIFGDDIGFTSENANSNKCSAIVRSCRQDAHGIIKHVTATLLEVRPGLASSPVMTELTASAVEALIFGELYDECFDEIIEQTREQDGRLVAKVESLRMRCNDGCTAPRDLGEDVTPLISLSAIAILQSLPQAHTPTDKLLCCVEFLELVSSYYSSLFQGQNKCIDADTLLAMVCQHVVTANIPHLHAEIAFIEEFSRDEQLLSGKEGYALITLQASLHYLDTLKELPRDMSVKSCIPRDA